MWWECPHNRFYSPIWFWLRTHTIPIKYQRHIWRTICYQKCVNEWGDSILQYTKCLPVHHTRTTNCDKVFIRKNIYKSILRSLFALTIFIIDYLISRGPHLNTSTGSSLRSHDAIISCLMQRDFHLCIQQSALNGYLLNLIIENTWNKYKIQLITVNMLFNTWYCI